MTSPKFPWTIPDVWGVKTFAADTQRASVCLDGGTFDLSLDGSLDGTMTIRVEARFGGAAVQDWISARHETSGAVSYPGRGMQKTIAEMLLEAQEKMIAIGVLVGTATYALKIARQHDVVAKQYDVPAPKPKE